MRIKLDMELKIDTIKRISLAKFLYNLAHQIFHPSRELSLFAGINLLQDSVEAFLLGLAEHVDIKARFIIYKALDLAKNSVTCSSVMFLTVVIKPTAPKLHTHFRDLVIELTKCLHCPWHI